MANNQFGGEIGQEHADALWVIITAFIIFTMQSGFGLLESGMVSERSEANVMIKNMIDVSLGGIAYWFVGYGFSFGPNTRPSKTMGGEGYFITDVDISGNEAYVYTKYFFQLSFATTATTIVSGAVAERVHLGAYMIFVVINTGFIYVFPCHWIWGDDGWLSGKAHDFAGSAVVHMAGGAAALAATFLLGPRLGRYEKDVLYFKMASPTNVVLGTFFLWWGWIGFNCGSQFAISGDNWRWVGRISVVTMNGGMAGGAAIAILNVILFRWRRYLIDIPEFTAGILSGLVSVTAGCNVFRPWEGLVVGAIGGLIGVGVIKFLDRIKIDDPVGCIGVHWGAGLWAMIAVGLFAEHGEASSKRNGVFRLGDGSLLGWNLLACLAVSVWSFGCTFIVFLILKHTMGIRLGKEDELKGSDEVEHNIVADCHEAAASHALGRRTSRAPTVLNDGDINYAIGRRVSRTTNPLNDGDIIHNLARRVSRVQAPMPDDTITLEVIENKSIDTIQE